MKGDFSKWEFNPLDNYTSVLHQQGRALMDQDWNAASQISNYLHQMQGHDVIGNNVAAVPIDARDSFKVTAASTDGTSVTLTLNNGRIWTNGKLLQIFGTYDTPVEVEYLGSLMQIPQQDASSIATDVRDAVILETWEEAINGFQNPKYLLEPALGGVDTTERVRHCHAIKLLRLNPGDDCGNLIDKLGDKFNLKGKLTVTAEEITISGDCPIEAGGGYAGFEHYLFRIEIAEPDSVNNARIKWSRFNAGLVGRGIYNSLTEEVSITANDQMINHCGLTSFYLEAMEENDQGCWKVVFSADAVLNSGALSLSNIAAGSVWPGDTEGKAFFRLWDGIAYISGFPVGPNPDELVEGFGIRLQLEAPIADNRNYKPGDYWTFPVRASGAVDFDPEISWPDNQLPEGVHFQRVPLAILKWDAVPTTSIASPDNIHDCRRIFKPLAKTDNCCSFTVGDGTHTYGDFNSIQEAIDHLPEQGGHICVLPGVYEENTVISKNNVHIKGCGDKTHIKPVNPLPAVLVDGIYDFSISELQISTHQDAPGISIDDINGLAKKININKLLINAAARSAIESKDAVDLSIVDNRINMMNIASVNQALFIVADDVLIEHNNIQVEMPQVNEGDALVYAGRGGIQMGGGAENIKIIDNQIRGGSGNGITLGALIEITEEGQSGFQIGWPMLGDNPCDPYKPGSVYIPGTEDETSYISAGALYDICIERNHIEDMGLNGIGVATFFDLNGADEFISIDGLGILGNKIKNCLTRELEAVPDAMKNSMGYGGIALADVENLNIYDNTIENNGLNHLEPICGIFLLLGEGVDISRNRIINNGAKTEEPSKNAKQGARGGVNIIYTTSPKIPIIQSNIDDGRLAPGQNGVASLTLQGNIISQPLGRALSTTALGPVSIQDNQLTTQGFDSRPSSPGFFATTVFIFNMGISNELYLQQLLFNGKNKNDKPVAYNPSLEQGLIAAPDKGIDEKQIFSYLGNGNILFNDNQVMLDLTDKTGIQLGLTSIAIATLDDLSFQDNQCDCSFDILDEFLLSQAFLSGISTRVSGNRFKESVFGCLLSALTLSLFSNMTSMNQATHCIKSFNLFGSGNLVNKHNTILFDLLKLCNDELQILEQAGKSLLSQANSQPQEVLTLLE